jgi:hypothetical protein
VKTCLLTRLLATCVVASAAALPLPAALAAGASGQIGNITYSISSAPNALDANAFAMTAADVRYRVMGHYATVSVMVQGACAEVLAVSVILQHNPKLNLEPFKASRSGRDLPLQELLQVTGNVLAGHCPMLQVLRPNIANHGYEGTLTRAGGWVLQDGHVPTEFDARAPVEVRMDDDFGTLRVLHRGTCEAEPRLLIEAVSPPLRDLSDKLFYDYAGLAAKAARRYAQQCRMAQRVSFALIQMPSNWLCAQTSECFMQARLVNGQWITGTEEFKPRLAQNPVASFVDMVEVLAAGRLDILKDYENYFGYFAASFFEAYSEVCRAHIRQPVSRVSRWTSVKTDGQGMVISEETTETRPVYVEAEYAWVYDVNEMKARQHLLWALPRLKTAADAMAFGSGSRQLRVWLKDHCTDELRLTVLQNLVNHSARKPPVTGKYSTAKEPIVREAQDDQSAPVFTRAYVLQRQERIAATAYAPAPAAPREPAPASPAGPSVAPTAAPMLNMAELQRQHIEAMAALEQDYRTKMQGANAFQRIKLEAELKYKKVMLERELRDNLKRAQRP